MTVTETERADGINWNCHVWLEVLASLQDKSKMLAYVTGFLNFAFTD